MTINIENRNELGEKILNNQLNLKKMKIIFNHFLE